MKVFGRILLKTGILCLVIAAGAAGAVGWRTYQRSGAGYIMNQYLEYLMEGRSGEAYELLDQSEERLMTEEEYAKALEGKQYGLSAGFTVNEQEKRVDSDGSEYVDFRAEFRDAEDQTLFSDDFIVKKQAKKAFGIFDQWKVLSGHCMVKNLELTVPAGAQVWLDGQPVDTAWIVRDDVPYSLDRYRIPGLLPGRMNLVVRHPALEALNTTLDTNAGNQDYSAQMTLKKAAEDECTELAVLALRQLYGASVKEEKEGLDLFGLCTEQAEGFVDEQGKAFHEEDRTFQSVAVSGFVPQCGEPVYPEGESSSFTVEMTLGYHYLLREDVTADTDELQEDGSAARTIERESSSGDSTAGFVMAYGDGAWSIASIEIPLIQGKRM